MNSPKKIKRPWSTKAVMEQIYAKKLWGNNATPFYSGEGSHLPAIVTPYVEAVSTFLRQFDPLLVVCDLGCGDFYVGKQLVSFAKKYIAVDIVQDVIDYNATTYNTSNVKFECLDISTDALPAGDCALVRQVLQHLSNTEIERILNKLQRFRYIILTEHLPVGDFMPNVPIISGQGTRLKKGSGVCIIEAPFYFQAMHTTELVTVVTPDGKSKIVTTLYKMG